MLPAQAMDNHIDGRVGHAKLLRKSLLGHASRVELAYLCNRLCRQLGLPVVLAPGGSTVPSQVKCGSRYMRPNLSLKDSRDGGRADVKGAGECCSRLTFGIAPANRQYVILAEDGHIVSLPPKASLLRYHIGHIVIVSPKKEVIWAHASAVIAAVASKEPLGDRTIMQLVGNAVSPSATARLITDFPIASQVDSAGPDPAVVGLCYLRPEALSQGTRIMSIACTRFAAELATAVPYSGRPHIERLAAVGTGTLDSTTGCGRMRVHRKLTPFGVMPPAVASSAGAFCCPDYSTTVRCAEGGGIDA